MYVDYRLLDLLPQGSCDSTTLIITGGPVPTSFSAPNFLRVTSLAEVMAEGSVLLESRLRFSSPTPLSPTSPIPALFSKLITSPSPYSIHTICYTSGTTGNPKGCVITQRNVTFMLQSMKVHLSFEISLGTVHFSYLPLSHVFERIVTEGMLGGGGEIRYMRWNPSSKVTSTYLLEDLKVARPTLFTAAPRVLEKIRSGLEAKVTAAGGMKSKLYNYGIKTKSVAYASSQSTHHPLFDKLLFSKIRAALGLDRCTMLISGSAPLRPSTFVWLSCILPGTAIIEGYGLTETTGGVTVARPGEGNAGCVGGNVNGVEVRIVNVEGVEEGGEIEVRGENVIDGYYVQGGGYKSCKDKDGWFKTGDIGVFEGGGLRILDRIKNCFKLQQGEFVSAEKIEAVVMGVTEVDQCLVYGDGTRDWLVVVVVLAEGCEGADKEVLRSNIMATCRAAKLNGFEVPREVVVASEAWTPDNKFTTPTFKVVRNKVKAAYKREIEEAYRRGGARSKL